MTLQEESFNSSLFACRHVCWKIMPGINRKQAFIVNCETNLNLYHSPDILLLKAGNTETISFLFSVNRGTHLHYTYIYICTHTYFFFPTKKISCLMFSGYNFNVSLSDDSGLNGKVDLTSDKVRVSWKTLRLLLEQPPVLHLYQWYFQKVMATWM